MFYIRFYELGEGAMISKVLSETEVAGKMSSLKKNRTRKIALGLGITSETHSTTKWHHGDETCCQKYYERRNSPLICAEISKVPYPRRLNTYILGTG